MLNKDECGLPARGERREDGLGGNRTYADYSGLGWKDAKTWVAREVEVLSLLKGCRNVDSVFKDYIAHNVRGERFAVNDDVEDDDIGEAAYDDAMCEFDPGVGSTVAALYALGCVPYYSCNGGAFGDHHHAKEPMVVFYAHPARYTLLNAAADKAGVFVGPSDDGTAIVVAENIEALPRFASALIEMHNVVPKDVASRGRRRTSGGGPDAQMRFDL